MKKILVPVDFSKPALNAAEVAADIARKTGAQVILLHVIEEIVGDSVKVTGDVGVGKTWESKVYTVKLVEKAKKQLAKLSEDPRLAGVRTRTELRLGTPYNGMNAIVSEQKVDLVVMGTAGRTDLESMIIGSNTEKVVRRDRKSTR